MTGIRTIAPKMACHHDAPSIALRIQTATATGIIGTHILRTAERNSRSHRDVVAGEGIYLPNLVTKILIEPI